MIACLCVSERERERDKDKENFLNQMEHCKIRKHKKLEFDK